MAIQTYDPVEFNVLETGVQFRLQGPRFPSGVPLWEAQVMVLAHGRTFFSDARAVSIPAVGSEPRLPGTLLVRVRVLAVRMHVNGTTSTFQGPRNGQVAAETTVLMEAGPWSNADGNTAALASALCLSGQFPLTNYYAQLPSPILAALAPIFGPRPITELVAASSGLLLTATAAMPDGVILANPAPYLVEVESPVPALAVRLDPERLGSRDWPGVRGIDEYFRALEARLNPLDPAAARRAALKWMRLERVDAARPTRFFWHLRPAAAPVLTFLDGEWRLLIADQSLAEADVSPRGVLSAAPRVSITAGGNVTAVLGTMPALTEPMAVYSAARSQGVWGEQWKLTNLRLGYDPVDAAARLRAIAGLPTPRAGTPNEISDSDALTGRDRGSDGFIDPSVLWAFVPQQDGWAQIPVFNLTEQLTVDSFPEPWMAVLPAAEVSLFRGGAIFGNDREGLYNPADGVPPWNLTLLDAEALDAEWQFTAGVLERVSVRLAKPEVAMEGALWYATTPPTAADALPDLDDWLTGLDSLPLRTHQAGEVFPCPFEIAVSELDVRRTVAANLGLAVIQTFAWVYRANDTKHLGRVTAADFPDQSPRLPDTKLQAKAPLIVWLTALTRSRFRSIAEPGLAWRRHPSHPCVQALPMTQSAVPANFPSASRQLVPFELPLVTVSHIVPLGLFANGTVTPLAQTVTVTTNEPDDWSWVGIAGRWGWDVGRDFNPAASWVARLLLVPLGLPGLALQPAAGVVADATRFLKAAQYRHDLPLLEQPFTLAELPPEKVVEVRPAPPPALERADYARHWQALSDRAVLSETEEAESLTGTATALAIRGLAEPLTWAIAFTADLNGYPGSITMTDAADASRSIRLAGEADDALRGIEGGFAEQGGGLVLAAPGAAADIRVVGGSTAARRSNGFLRDQRGGGRGDSHGADGLLRTPITIHNESWTLATLTASPLPLHVGPHVWNLWYKDLPMRGGTLAFVRTETASPHRRGVNDPAATGRDFGPLNGYEWRLGFDPQPWLPLGLLRFYPLALEEVRLASIIEPAVVRILGRLQLPAWNDSATTPRPADRELADLDSAVVLTFSGGVLTRIVRAEPDTEPAETGSPPAMWPLVVRKVDTEAPTLLWTDRAPGGVSTNMLVGTDVVVRAAHLRLVFTRHGVLWSLPAADDLRIPLDGTAPAAVGFTPDPVGGDGSGVTTVRLTIDPAAAHRLTARWVFRLGLRDELWLEAGIDDELLTAPAPSPLTAALRHGNTQSHALLLQAGQARLGAGALQMTWDRLQALPNGLQVLPGCHLPERPDACRGGAVLAWDLQARPDAPPRVVIRGGSINALFDAEWGRGLQTQAGLPFDAAALTEAAFDSSAGTLVADYTSGWTGGGWTSDLMLSGLIEVKNLVSWPTALEADGTNAIRIPAPAGRPLSHWRHTVRLLLAEHRPPRRTLRGATAPDCLLTFAADAAWTVPAVVEHQLVRLEMGLDGRVTAAPTHERRWTVAQDVRFVAPRALYAHLVDSISRRSLNSPQTDRFQTTWPVSFRHNGHDGIEQHDFLSALNIVDTLGSAAHPFEQTALAALGESLLVDASASLFVGATPREGVATTPLFPAASGGVVAALAAETDTTRPATELDRAWLFLQVPCLGRLQSRRPANPTAPLVQDPVRQVFTATTPLPPLVRQLTHWANAPQQQQTTIFDRAELRFFRRLDATSLAEAWQRLNRARHAGAQPAGPTDLLPGATVAAPSNAVAVLGRAASLATLFDPNLATWPPESATAPRIDSPAPGGFFWTPAAILEFQTAIAPLNPRPQPYPFMSWPLVLLGSEFLELPVKPGVSRHPVATLVPTAAATTRLRASLALSPFRALDVSPFAAAAAPLLATGELVVFDTRHRAGIASTTVVHPTATSTAETLDAEVTAWAADAHARLAADSAVALIRVRQLIPRGGTQVELRVRFRLAAIAGPATFAARRAVALRATPARLRQPQGAFTGTAMPRLKALREFEWAPPLVRGQQPLRLPARPLAGIPVWPWGFSGLRLSTVYRAADAGTTGETIGASPAAGSRLWWQSLALEVQYAVTDRPLLPAAFRAPALAGYAPVGRRLPWPDVKPFVAGQQPVLPGSRQALLTGLRSGVAYALRESLSIQWLDAPGSETSGSVPTQPRFPRPVLLPANVTGRADIALRPYASAFDLAANGVATTTVRVSEHPGGEFFTLRDGQPRALRVTLRAPRPAEIPAPTAADEEIRREQIRRTSNACELPAAWDGWLFLSLEALPDAGDTAAWPRTLVLSTPTEMFAYQATSERGTVNPATQVWFKPENAARVKAWFDARRHGDAAVVVITVTVPNAIANSQQSLRLLLRVNKSGFPLPFAPRLLTFEDPEYNRALASTPSRTERAVTLNGTTLTLAFVADRPSYNTTGAIHYVFYRSKNEVSTAAIPPLPGTVTIDRHTQEGNDIRLASVVLTEQTLPGPDALDLATLARQANQTLLVGDELILRLTVSGVAGEFILRLPIVAAPATPVPDAGYALLRRSPRTAGVVDECVRFAWSPDAAQVELLDPADLTRAVVRRRAVFAWRDTINRRDTATRWAVQKSTALGSTHFPDIVHQP